MTFHQFNTKVAEKYGINAAIILQNIVFWTERKVANGQSADDGLFYIYNSIPAWGRLFPYMTRHAIRGALKKLMDEGVITSRNDLNSAGYDRTNHYALTAKSLISFMGGIQTMDSSENPDGQSEKPRPIPDSKPITKPDSKPITKPDSKPCAGSDDQKNGNGYTDDFEAIWKLYPRKAGKEAAFKVWKRLKPDKELTATIFEEVAWQKKYGYLAGAEKRYMPHMATWLNNKRWQDEREQTIQDSRHHGFDRRDYTDGLTDNGDGTYGF